MPKILVADDNRNIATMVEKALKDQGIEVFGVANGEAAVKKLPDLLPDLLLADVFMPVRDGYELCEWVKNNEKLAHIPVFLLVGAFDPLDEHRVQSVRADGVLKKPFVPPDPLITVVKAMLERAAKSKVKAETRAQISKAHEEFAATVPHYEETQKLAPEEVARLTGSGTPVAKPAAEPEPEIEEFAVRSQRVEFGDSDQPVAFGDMLGTDEAENEPESTFRASSVLDHEERRAAIVEPERVMDAAPQVEATPEPSAEETQPITPVEAKPEVDHYAGIVEEARQPSPDLPPIKVDFSSSPSEPMELVTDETPGGVSTMQVAPASELVSNPAEWTAPPAPPVPSYEPPPIPVIAPEPAVAPTGVKSSDLPGLAWSPHAEPLAAAVAAETAAVAPGADPALVEAVVAKVLQRLEPRILEQLTRDIVRPLAEALIRRELDKK